MVRKYQLKMVKHMSMNNKGFTLLETLFVMFLICLLSSITMTLHIPKKSDENMIVEINSFLYQAKLNAMLNKETTTVTFSKKEIVASSSNYEQSYHLPNNSYFESYQMTFNEFGNIKIAKKLTFHTSNKTYYYVFQIGSGSHYVEK